jgi:hypothetical protein
LRRVRDGHVAEAYTADEGDVVVVKPCDSTFAWNPNLPLSTAAILDVVQVK